MLKYASGGRKIGACRLLTNPKWHTDPMKASEHSEVFVCRSKLPCCRQQGRCCVLRLFLLLIMPLLPPHSAMCFDLSPAKTKTRAMQGVIYYDKMHDFTPCFVLKVVIRQQFCYRENDLFNFLFFQRD